MKEYFTFQELYPNEWSLRPVFENFNANTVSGSYNLLACRISGLSWANWLRFCQQYGATLYGKNNHYITCKWKKPNPSFLALMNERANEIFKEVDPKELNL